MISRDDMLRFVPGAWRSAPPTKLGVYLARRAGDPSRTWTEYWSPGRTATELEWFYIEGDPNGEPTLIDDQRMIDTATRNGWTPKLRHRKP